MTDKPHIFKTGKNSAEMEPCDSGNWYKAEYVETLQKENSKRLAEISDITEENADLAEANEKLQEENQRLKESRLSTNTDNMEAAWKLLEKNGPDYIKWNCYMDDFEDFWKAARAWKESQI